MAITGLRSFHYPVHNLEKAKMFYTQCLSFEFDYEQPGWCALKMDGAQVALHPEESPIPEIKRDAHGAHAGGCLTLASDNITQDREKIEAFGVKVLGEMDAPWGHMLTFEDPDGNVLKLMNAKY